MQGFGNQWIIWSCIENVMIWCFLLYWCELAFSSFLVLIQVILIDLYWSFNHLIGHWHRQACVLNWTCMLTGYWCRLIQLLSFLKGLFIIIIKIKLLKCSNSLITSFLAYIEINLILVWFIMDVEEWLLIFSLCPLWHQFIILIKLVVLWTVFRFHFIVHHLSILDAPSCLVPGTIIKFIIVFSFLNFIHLWHFLFKRCIEPFHSGFNLLFELFCPSWFSEDWCNLNFRGIYRFRFCSNWRLGTSYRCALGFFLHFFFLLFSICFSLVMSSPFSEILLELSLKMSHVLIYVLSATLGSVILTRLWAFPVLIDVFPCNTARKWNTLLIFSIFPQEQYMCSHGLCASKRHHGSDIALNLILLYTLSIEPFCTKLVDNLWSHWFKSI